MKLFTLDRVIYFCVEYSACGRERLQRWPLWRQRRPARQGLTVSLTALLAGISDIAING
jgi:hypothetical protein